MTVTVTVTVAVTDSSDDPTGDLFSGIKYPNHILIASNRSQS